MTITHTDPAALLAALPTLLSKRLAPRLTNISSWPDHPEHVNSLIKILACSDFLTRILERPPVDEATLFSPRRLNRPYQTGDHLSYLQTTFPPPNQLNELKRILRLHRQFAMFTIAWRDIIGQADLAETFLSLSELAEASLRYALKFLVEWDTPRYGRARGSSGQALDLLVLGMGKLGGVELNFSSDIDLIFFYAEEGETDGKRQLSNNEYFSQLGKKLISALDEITEDGFVFRVDMRLRPFGRNGPLAMSFAAAEHYYQAHGRTWERYALIKARAVAGNPADANEFFAMIKPFVYRRYIDFGVLESLREMKQKITREIGSKESENNIKVGRGGIREIEFIGQAFQLIRGGKQPLLQIRPIQKVLDQLNKLSLLPKEAADNLQTAYVFLRKIENYLQLINDEQTHSLPSNELGQLRLVMLMGFSNWNDLSATLAHHRDAVHRHFLASIAMDEDEPDGTMHDSAQRVFITIWQQKGSRTDQLERLAKAGFEPTEEALDALNYLKESSGYRILTETGRLRMNRLMPTLLEIVSTYPKPASLLQRIFTLLQRVISRACYISLLAENPQALVHLIKLCAASPWIAESMAAQPMLFDDLLNPETLYSPLRRHDLRIDLEQRLIGIDPHDLDRQMDELRRFAHTHRLRTAAADIVGSLPVMKVSDCLTETAEVVLEKALALAWDNLLARHGRPTAGLNGKRYYPGFSVVAYGKLGGIELGYSSDLDLVFIHDSQGENTQTEGPRVIDNSDFFMRLGKKLIHYLTTRTAAGILYEIDMRLRPSGNSGLLVVDTEGFANYQRQSAWTWEHQAIIRARPVAGSAKIADFFNALREEVINQPRNPEKLREQIIEMRQKMDKQEPPSPLFFDLKSGYGGITDIEFLVQYFMLKWSAQTPGLIRYTDNIRLLEGLAESGRLEQKTVSFMMDAYRAYRTCVHRLALQAKKPRVATTEHIKYRLGIKRIWSEHMGAPRPPEEIDPQ